MVPNLLVELMREVSDQLPGTETFFHSSYSIQGNPGKVCPAVTGQFDHVIVVVAEIIKQAVGLHTEDPRIPIDGVIDTILSFKVDKLRADLDLVIIYWPTLPAMPLSGLDNEVDDFGD